MPRPTRLRIETPADYWLPAAICSYGYFLLAPNRWRPEELALERAFNAAEFGLPSEVFHVRLDQPSGQGAPVRVISDRPLAPPLRTALRQAVVRMARTDRDLQRWRRLHPAAARRGFGRLYRSPTLFEDMVKTITNCNVGWPSTVRMNRLLVDRYGKGAFPTPERLARLTPSRLQKSCKVGYRAKRIVRLARQFVSGELTAEWFESPERSDEEVREALLSLEGFGPYAASNVMQLLGRDDVLPIDTEGYRLHEKRTGENGPRDPKRLEAAITSHYEPYRPHRFLAYWYDLWRDYESQRGPAWTWEPREVGDSFTADRLD